MTFLATNTNIIFTSGFTKGLLVDPYRNHIQYIPNSLIDFVTLYSGKSVDNLTSGDINQEIVNEYLDFLISNEFCFIVETEEQAARFTNNQLTFDSPHILTNCIFQIGTNVQLENVRDILLELESCECWFIEFFLDDSSIDRITSILSLLEKLKFNCVFIHYNAEGLVNESLNTLIEFFKNQSSAACKIKSFVFNIYGTQLLPNEIQSGNVYIRVHNKILPRNLNCGAIKKEYFSLHVENLRESLHHNSCLNRKVSIDYDGNIKNCPSLPDSYGNIKDTTLAEAIEKPDFTKYWDITKDKIHVCKDCEFRYICTDCRAYVEDPEDILSKPLKCGYNPYTGEWSEWTTNPLKQKAIDFYGMREMVDKKD